MLHPGDLVVVGRRGRLRVERVRSVGRAWAMLDSGLAVGPGARALQPLGLYELVAGVRP